MSTIDHEIHIERSLEDVFDFLADRSMFTAAA
jgi:hypothetical protein